MIRNFLKIFNPRTMPSADASTSSTSQESRNVGDEEEHSEHEFTFQLIESGRVKLIIPVQTSTSAPFPLRIREAPSMVWDDLYSELANINWEVRNVLFVIVLPNGGRFTHLIKPMMVDLGKKEMILGNDIMNRIETDGLDGEALLCRSDILSKERNLRKWNELFDIMLSDVQQENPKKLIILFLPSSKLLPYSSFRRFSTGETNHAPNIGVAECNSKDNGAAETNSSNDGSMSSDEDKDK